MNKIYLKIDSDGELFAEYTLNGKKSVYKNKNNGNDEEQYLNILLGKISTYNITGYNLIDNDLHLEINDIELVICDFERFKELNNINAKNVLLYINESLLEEKNKVSAMPVEKPKKANRNSSVAGVVAVVFGATLLISTVASVVKDMNKDKNKNDIIFTPDMSISGQYIEPIIPDNQYYDPNNNWYNVPPAPTETPMIPPFNQENIVVVPNSTPTPPAIIDDVFIETTNPYIPETPINTPTPTPVPTTTPVETPNISNNEDNFDPASIASIIGNDQSLMSSIMLVGDSYNQEIMSLGKTGNGLGYYNFNTNAYENITLDDYNVTPYSKAMEINIKFNYCLKQFKGNHFAALLAYYNGITPVYDRLFTSVAPSYGLSYDEFLANQTNFSWVTQFADFPSYSEVERVLSSLPNDYVINGKVMGDDGQARIYSAIVSAELNKTAQDAHNDEFVF